MKSKILVQGCGFPNFTGTSTYVQLNERHIVVDTGALNHRNELLDNLVSIDVSCDEITDLVITHMHMDHFANMGLFMNATIYLTKREYYFHKLVLRNKELGGKKQIVKMWKSMESWRTVADNPLLSSQEDVVYDTIRPFTDDELNRIKIIDFSKPIAEGIYPIECVGHSYGHMAVHFQDHEEHIVAIGDGLPNRRWFERVQSGTLSRHKEIGAYRANIKKIQEIGRCIVIPGHDSPFDSETLEYINLSKQF